MDHARLKTFFSSSPELARLCTQNGWPDPASMHIDLLEETDTYVVCAVNFDEVIMEGSGCEAGRVACWGRFRLPLNQHGEITTAELVAGER